MALKAPLSLCRDQNYVRCWWWIWIPKSYLCAYVFYFKNKIKSASKPGILTAAAEEQNLLPQEHKSSYLISQNSLESFLSFHRKHKHDNYSMSPKPCLSYWVLCCTLFSKSMLTASSLLKDDSEYSPTLEQGWTEVSLTQSIEHTVLWVSLIFSVWTIAPSGWLS